MFDDNQVIPLVNNTKWNNVVLANQIDLGQGEAGYRTTRALTRNIGEGNPIPLQGVLSQITAPVVLQAYFTLETSADNATYSVLFNSSILHAVGDTLDITRTPRGTLRYLRMRFYYKITSGNAASKTVTVTSAIGTTQSTAVGDI